MGQGDLGGGPNETFQVSELGYGQRDRTLGGRVESEWRDWLAVREQVEEEVGVV